MRAVPSSSGRTRPRSAVALALAALVAVSAACGESFDPPSYLNDLRVLALAADPLEVVATQPGGTTVTATASVYVPPDATVTRESWRFCALSAGAFGGYECLFPEDCEVDLTATAEPLPAGPGFINARVTADVVALGAPCAARLAAESGADGPPTGDPGDPPPGAPGAESGELVAEVLLRYQVETADGASRDAVLRLPVWLVGAPDPPNRPPAFERVEWGGAPVTPGQTLPPVTEDQLVELRVVTAEESLDDYQDEADRDRTEEPIVSVYATAGRFEVDRRAGADAKVEWEATDLEEDQTAADIFLVLRDLRGGQTTFGPFQVPITRTPAP